MGRRLRKAVLIALAGLVLLVLVAAWILVPYSMRVQHFSANPQQGYSADFYLYLSPGARERGLKGEKVVLLVQPNNSGTNSDDPEVHRKDAWWTGFGRHSLADDLEVALLVPAFVRPAKDWQVYTHALDRDVLTTDRADIGRIDLQLLAMIDQVSEHLAGQDLAMEPRILLQGYSASGMFANRFAFLHPDRVMAVSAGSPGGWPIAPISRYEQETLDWPAGVADMQTLTGKPFDRAAMQQVPQLIVMGDEDTNDSVDFIDGWDKPAAEQLERLFGTTPLDRWQKISEIYRQQGMQADFLLVPGVGHDRKALQKHTTGFFRRQLNRDADP